MEANERQVGGIHYKSEYQHWDWAHDLRMLYLPGTAAKYFARWRHKNGLEDLEKGIHYLEKCIERKVNIIPTIDREDFTMRFLKANDFTLEEAAILGYIADGEWEKALIVAQGLLEEARTYRVANS